MPLDEPPEGILVINKPRGLTSHDVVNRVRRITGQRRAGHAGTLDPLATGVLVLCLGRATRLAEYAAGHDKTYCAEIVLGTSTDTYDAEGRVTAIRPVAADESDVRRALAGFVGDILQRPPAYSAIKRDGEPLYKAARAGQEVVTEPRPVTIRSIDLVAYQPPELTVIVECGKGTYIRSLAHDLGQALGCGAHMSALVRLRSGRFSLAEALTLDDLALAMEQGWLAAQLYPPDEAVLDAPAMILGADRADRACRGGGLPLSPRQEAAAGQVLCRAYDLAGEFIALGQLDRQAGWWQPEKVLRPCY